MELRYACPQCGTENLRPAAEHGTVLSCDRCGYAGVLPTDWTREGRVALCPICGTTELYRQKDFNHKLGILVLIAGALFAFFTRYLSLVAAALLDLVLYLTAPEVLICYRCRAHIRGHRPSGDHGRYDARIERDIRDAGDPVNPQGKSR